MKTEYFCIEQDGFYGAYYENAAFANTAFIAMIGDSSDDRLAKCSVKWLQKLGCNVLCMSPGKKDYGHHSVPLERFASALNVLKERGNTKFAVIGASTTGMMALLAASFYQDITLTIALTPPDFVMEGFYQDKLDGAGERPGNNESTVTWKGEALPYLPFAYRHPEYWQRIKAESKESGSMIACRKLFDESEKRHPLLEEEKIKIENIKGKLVLVGAKDDALWDTCKYICRIEERLNALPHDCSVKSLVFEHGTHFVFPESLLKAMFPVGSGSFVRLMFKEARKHPKECRKTRVIIDKELSAIIKDFAQ